MTGPAAALGPDRAAPERLVRGEGRFVGDRLPPGCLHAVFVRSREPRGRLLDVETAAAAAWPGVVRVFTGADLAATGSLAVNPVVDGIRDPARPLIARTQVAAVGEVVAMVVAADAASAGAAAERVGVAVDPWPAVVDPLAALDHGPLLPGWPDNRMLDRAWRTDGVDQAFAACPHVVHVTLAMPRVAPLPLEPRAALVQPDRGGLQAWLATQTPHRARADLARLLALDPAAVRVVAPDVGGAFGGKASLYPEDVLVAFAALRLGRPVAWTATRLEDFLAASHGRGAHLRASLALAADGTARALRADLVFPVGAWGTFSAAVPAWNAARILPGPYRIEAVDVRTRAVVVNTAAVGIYRGAGRPEAALLTERLMDAAAVRLGMDPIALRRLNLRGPAELPRALASGAVLDTGDFPALLARAHDLADYPALRDEQRRRRAAGERVGIGVALFVEPCGQGWESATVSREADGGFSVASGASSQGQDHATLFAALAAEVLGVPAASIRVREGDTATTPTGIGALASRSTAIGGSAVAAAARGLRERLAAAPPGTPVHAHAVYTAAREAWSSGCMIALVSVDPETAQPAVERLVWVEDAGRLIDPVAAHAQCVGGLVQGLGSVLLEALRYDDAGQLQTGSLLDYPIPRIDQRPGSLRIESAPTATDANPLGARGVGEAGCVAAPPAILNAVLDALAPHGVRELTPPLTAARLWSALRAARLPPEPAP